jgi:hypothetical protein
VYIRLMVLRNSILSSAQFADGPGPGPARRQAARRRGAGLGTRNVRPRDRPPARHRAGQASDHHEGTVTPTVPVRRHSAGGGGGGGGGGG